jgi:outer membrane murein-binding lipoprotein Lpp
MKEQRKIGWKLLGVATFLVGVVVSATLLYARVQMNTGRIDALESDSREKMALLHQLDKKLDNLQATVEAIRRP